MAPHKAGISKVEKKQKKENYLTKLHQMFEEYDKIVLVKCDNVGSHQFQIIRKETRGQCEIIMGKNTLMRKAIKMASEKHPHLHLLLEHIKGNTGFVFTKMPLNELKAKLAELKAPSPAKAGTIAPNDVIVPAGDTGLDPTQTNFLQALNITTKISKSQIEIISDVLLIKQGEKVGVSQAVLLQKLKINPFKYGIEIDTIYDNGNIYGVEGLDVTEEVCEQKIGEAVSKIAGLSLALNIPTLAAAPHLIRNAFYDMIAASMAEPELEFAKGKEYIDGLKSGAAVAAAAPVAATEEKKEAVEEKKEEEEEEAEGDFGFGDLF